MLMLSEGGQHDLQFISMLIAENIQCEHSTTDTEGKPKKMPKLNSLIAANT